MSLTFEALYVIFETLKGAIIQYIFKVLEIE